MKISAELYDDLQKREGNLRDRAVGYDEDVRALLDQVSNLRECALRARSKADEIHGLLDACLVEVPA